MHAEPPGDRNHALAVRSGSSNSVHLAFCQRCSSSSPRVRYDLGLVLGCILRLVPKTEFRLFPRGTQPLEPLWQPAGYMRNVVETVTLEAA